jgi:hypothetical protein
MSCYHEETGILSASALLGSPVSGFNPTSNGAGIFVTGNSKLEFQEPHSVFSSHGSDGNGNQSDITIYAGLMLEHDKHGVLHLTIHTERYGSTGEHWREELENHWREEIDPNDEYAETYGTIRLARCMSYEHRQMHINQIEPIGGGLGRDWHRDEALGAMFRAEGDRIPDVDYTDAHSNMELGRHMKIAFQRAGAEDGQEVRFYFV